MRLFACPRALCLAAATLMALAPSGEVRAQDRAAYVAGWSRACQTQGKEGLRISPEEASRIQIFVYSGLDAHAEALRSFGGTTRPMAKVRAEVCTCIATALSKRRDLSVPPGAAEMRAAFTTCTEDVRLLP